MKISDHNPNIRAMVLAAGIGSRLQPISDIVPKPLFHIGGKPVMDHILLLLKKHGITQIISNTHHLAEQITNHYSDAKTRLGIDISFVYEEKLSGVAGGIRCCQDFLKQGTSCIIMGDALTDIDLSDLYFKHLQAVKEHGALVSIAQKQVDDTSQFGVIVTESLVQQAGSMRVLQFQEKPSAQEALSNWANTGIYFFEPEVYSYIPSIAEAPFYDVARDLFPKLLQAGVYMQAISVSAQSYWADIGTPQQYLDSLQDIANNKVSLETIKLISPSAQISAEAELIGANEIGSETVIEANTRIENSVIWDNVFIPQGCSIQSSIIGSGVKLEPNTKLEMQFIAHDYAMLN